MLPAICTPKEIISAFFSDRKALISSAACCTFCSACAKAWQLSLYLQTCLLDTLAHSLPFCPVANPLAIAFFLRRLFDLLGFCLSQLLVFVVSTVTFHFTLTLHFKFPRTFPLRCLPLLTPRFFRISRRKQRRRRFNYSFS